MKTLILDYKKWRCGNDAGRGFSKGVGDTALLNEEGYMCCLGQFSLQLDSSLKKKELFEVYAPISLKKMIPLLTKKRKNKNGFYRNSSFSDLAMRINDECNTTIDEKISKLRVLCKEHNYRLKVINRKK